MEWGAVVQSDTEWWVLDFTSMWQETDLALCSFYDGKEHLWKILVLSPPVSPVVSQHCLFFFAEGEPLHPDWDTVSQRLCLGLVSKETWKAEQRYSLELVPLRCCFRQFKSWGAGQDCERWATYQEVSRKRLQGSPAGSDCPALHAARPPGTQHLWNRKAPCASLYLPCVCVQPGFLKSTKHWGAQGSASVGREKCRYLEWEKRCLSGEANREAGKFPGGSSRLANVFSRVPNSSAEVCGCSRSC